MCLWKALVVIDDFQTQYLPDLVYAVRDQLLVQREKNLSALEKSFDEHMIKSDTYDLVSRCRLPSWCSGWLYAFMHNRNPVL